MREELRTSYSMKERAELLLSNLDKLKAEGAIGETEYKTLKAEYVSMLDEATPWINSIKAELQKALDGKGEELRKSKQELGILQARLKVGEIPTETYRGRGRPLEEKVEQLEREVSELQTLVNSSCTGDIGGPKDISLPKLRGKGAWKEGLKNLSGWVARLFSRLRKAGSR